MAVRARCSSSVTSMGSPVTYCMQLSHMAIDTSQTPRPPGSLGRVARCGIRCSASLSNSIVYATSAWDSSVGRGTGMLSPCFLSP